MPRDRRGLEQKMPNLHTPERQPDESQKQYRERHAASKRANRELTSGHRVDYSGRRIPIYSERPTNPKVRRGGVSHRQEKRARMAPLRALLDAARAA